jgi:hypothetical protein
VGSGRAAAAACERRYRCARPPPSPSCANASPRPTPATPEPTSPCSTRSRPGLEPAELKAPCPSRSSRPRVDRIEGPPAGRAHRVERAAAGLRDPVPRCGCRRCGRWIPAEHRRGTRHPGPTEQPQRRRCLVPESRCLIPEIGRPGGRAPQRVGPGCGRSRHSRSRNKHHMTRSAPPTNQSAERPLERQAARSQHDAAEEARKAARELSEDGVPLRDFGRPMGCVISTHTNSSPTHNPVSRGCPADIS